MSENLQQRAQKKVDALEAEIVEIRATAEESKKLRAGLLSKTTIIRKHVEAQQKTWGILHGPMRIGGTWYV
jgi:hypothetical protein